MNILVIALGCTTLIGMETNEQWIQVEGTNGFYEVSNTGHVRAMFFRNRVAFFKRIKVLAKLNGKDGYHLVNMFQKTYSLARVVAKHFIPNPENKPQVNHKNGIKTDNRVENLEWATVNENRMHAFETGLTPRHLQALGPDDIRAIRIRLLSEPELKIASDYGVCQKTVNNIKNGKTWSHVI